MLQKRSVVRAEKSILPGQFMRLQDQRQTECLRRLHGIQARTVGRFSHQAVGRGALDGIHRRDGGYTAAVCFHRRQRTLDDLFRHTVRFLELGAEDCLALGSDFDGCPLAPCLSSPEQSAGLYACFRERGFSQTLAEKILFRNALEFFRANLR